MEPHTWVRTVIHCSRHRRDSGELCVKVDREVPRPLRCTPYPGGNSAEGSGSLNCPCEGRFDTADLVRRVADALRRGVGRWIQLGHVVIEL